MSGSATPTVPVANFGIQMVSPASPFVNTDGTLAPLPYRFLFLVWNVVSNDHAVLANFGDDLSNIFTQLAELAAEVNNLNAQVANIMSDFNLVWSNFAAQDNENAYLQGQINNIFSDINTIWSLFAAQNNENAYLQGQINTINARLAAAGIP